MMTFMGLSDINSVLMMAPTDFGDPLTFPHMPSWWLCFFGFERDIEQSNGFSKNFVQFFFFFHQDELNSSVFHQTCKTSLTDHLLYLVLTININMVNIVNAKAACCFLIVLFQWWLIMCAICSTIWDYMRSSGEKHVSIAHMSHQCLFKGSCFFILHSSAL